jgi:oligo-1,6-glucosidase
MDVINLISKPTGDLVDGVVPPGRRLAPGMDMVANGPRLDEFLAEMNAAVGLSAQNLITVGEMPGSTIEVARRATDPARNELNMVFTFEHVNLDQKLGGAKWDLEELRLPLL